MQDFMDRQNEVSKDSIEVDGTLNVRSNTNEL